MDPGALNLAKLGNVLNFPPLFFSGDDLEEPPFDGTSFRALTYLTAKQRDQALGAGALALTLSDWIDQRFTLPAPAVAKLLAVGPEDAAMYVRHAWKLGEKPVRNMIHLLEAHGVRVFSLVEECRELDAFSFWREDTPFIFLNTVKSAEHSRMDSAHELGHLVMHWKGISRGKDTEREAEAFASAFLMPKGSIVADAPRGAGIEALIKAKHRWNVSLSALVYRMHTLSMLTDWQYRSLFIEISSHGFRTHEPEPSQPETSQVLAKVFKSLRDEGVTRFDVAEELALSPEEVDRLIFGLVLTPLSGSSNASVVVGQKDPKLRLV